MTKQYRDVTETHRAGDEYYFHGTLQEWQAKLAELINWHGEDAVMELEVEHGYYADESTNICFIVTVTRPETDDERDKRLADGRKRRVSAKKAAATRRVQKEADDRKQYEKLRKKFEGEGT